MKSRLEQLLELYKNEPQDPFLIYGLALEYQKTDKSKAEEYFNLLLEEQSDYIPTYYHAAKHFEEKGETERAKDIYKKGIEKSIEFNEAHALKELRNALRTLEDEEEWL